MEHEFTFLDFQLQLTFLVVRNLHDALGEVVGCVMAQVCLRVLLIYPLKPAHSGMQYERVGSNVVCDDGEMERSHSLLMSDSCRLLRT